MYKIYADNTLIYDSTLEDYKIGKGNITLEVNKSGSFTFSIYPDHFYYDKFVKMKTIIKVTKSDKIIFRGRVLNDTTDYWNIKTLVCEGEYGFFNDSIIRPFEYTGSPEDLFKKFIQEHNSQVDDFKKFKIGQITVTDPNNYIARSNSNYETTSNNLQTRLINDSLGGYFFITHGEDGTEEIPTINYLADFTEVAPQPIEFGSNLKDYTKTAKGDDIATAIIPLGKGENDTTLTIASVNNNVDYVYDPDAVALRGWIFKPVTWDDVTDANNLLTKAKTYLKDSINQNITIVLTAIDLHLLDRSIESFHYGEYIKIVSLPHGINVAMLCNKQEIDLLKPENDKITLGYIYSTFTETSTKVSNSVSSIPVIRESIVKAENKLTALTSSISTAETNAQTALDNYNTVSSDLSTVSGDLESVATAVTDNARNISTNASAIADNATNIKTNSEAIEDINTSITSILARLDKLENPTTENNDD